MFKKQNFTNREARVEHDHHEHRDRYGHLKNKKNSTF